MKNKIKVAYIFENFERAGIGVLLLDIARNVKDLLFDLSLITIGSGELSKEFDETKCEIFHLNRNFPLDFKLIFKIRKIVITNKIRIVHAHQAVEGLHAYLATLGTGVKTVLSFHGHIPSFKNDLVLKFLIPRVAANIAVSYGFLDRLRKESYLGRLKKFHVVYNGVNEDKILKSVASNLLTKYVPEQSIKLGMVGHFNSSGRDQMTICMALPEIIKNFNNLHFFFIGARSEKHPKYFDDCVNYCKNKDIIEHTHFLGAQENINSLLKELDIFVYSTNHDSFGIAIIEAMIAGLPVITNDIPPMLEITNNGKFAEIFISKSTKSLEKAISNVITNKELRKRLSENGKNWALEQFTISNHTKHLNKLYKSLLNK